MDSQLELEMDTVTVLARGIESGYDDDMLTCIRTKANL